MSPAVQSLAHRMADDLAMVGLQDRFALFSLRAGKWVVAPRGTSPPAPVGFEGDGHVAVKFGAEHLLAPGDPPGQEWAEAVSFLQDCVVDELGFGWPEVYEDGRFVAVLQPALVDDDVVWQGQGRTFAPVGGLGGLAGGTLKTSPDPPSS